VRKTAAAVRGGAGARPRRRSNTSGTPARFPSPVARISRRSTTSRTASSRRNTGPAADEVEEREWACSAALDRLGFASQGELARYFDAFSPSVAKAWIADNRHRLIEVEVAGAPGRPPRSAVAWADFEERLAGAPRPLPGLRVLAPFDPIVRDRKRAEQLFGFDYRFEAFVPAPKRQYGYYVLPILEGDRLTGRADLKTDRQGSTLTLQDLWWETGVKSGSGRRAALAAELTRLARFVGVDTLVDRCAGLEG